MKQTETHTNKTVLRLILAAAAVLILCGAAAGAAAAATPVNSEADLNAAIAAAVASGGDFDVILSADIITLSATLNISTGGTIDLNGKTIKAADSFSGTELIKFSGSDKKLTITDNSSNKGGTLDGNGKARVLYLDAGTVEMSAGTITGGSADLGGGVYVYSGSTFTMNGSASITGNSANRGGGVYVNDGTFNVSGTSVIRNNTKGTGETAAASNVYLAPGSTTPVITVTGELTDGAYIGIAAPLSGQFGVAGETGISYYKITSSDAACFHQDTGSLNALLVSNGDPYMLYWPVAKIESTEYTTVQEAADAAAPEATITMINDSAEETVVVDKKVTLDLAGYVLKNNGTPKTVGDEEYSKSVIYINSSGDLTVTDSSASDNKHYFIFVKDGPWTPYSGTPASSVPLEDFNRADAKEAEPGTYIVEVTGGCITGGSAGSGNGGGVYVNGGLFTMDSGNIIGNEEFMRGGGVEIRYGGSFTMKGTASIAGNTTQDMGGGVFVGIYAENEVKSTFIMENGRITGNAVLHKWEIGSEYGGGVYVSGGSFTMTGGFITENLAETDSGGVAVGVPLLEGVDEPGTFTMNGGRITGNEATNDEKTGYSGGVTVSMGCTMEMTGGEISNNRADTDTAEGTLFSGIAPCGLCCMGSVKVSGTAAVMDNKLKDGTDSNTTVFVIDGAPALALGGNLAGKIHITKVFSMIMPEDEEVPVIEEIPMQENNLFGTAEPGASGEENFVADAAGKNLVGSISGDKLVWKALPSRSSKSQGSSVWLTEPAQQTAEPTVTPTVTPTPTAIPTQSVPTVKPVAQPTSSGETPAPLAGILAGLGCAAVIFGLRRR